MTRAKKTGSGLPFVVSLSILMVCAPACSSGVESTGGVARVVVEPELASLIVPATRTLTATAYDSQNRRISDPAFAWSSSDETVATVSPAGLVTAVGAGTATITASSAGFSGQAHVSVSLTAPVGPTVTVFPNATFQTMNGWEATAQSGELECQPSFPIYQSQLFDRAISELGINRVRLEVRSGSENPVPWYEQLLAGQSTMDTWRQHRYEVINDNNDPLVLNAAGFHFHEVDYTVDQVVLPLRQRLIARGEDLYINLNYVDFGQSAFEHTTDPREYGEFMLALFQHMQGKYGFVPDAIEVSLEPDNTPNWRPATIGAAIVATGDRLAAAGFHPDFIAPSNTNTTRALEYAQELVQIPRVLEYLTEITYHRYGGVSDAAITGMATLGLQHGLRTSMLELIGADVDMLHTDLTLGRNGAWAQYALAFCETNNNGGRYYDVDISNPNAPVVVMESRARLLRQYFRWVRAGAVRLGATTSEDGLAAVAFRNANGKYVVVVRTPGPIDFAIDGVAAGTYGINYSTIQQFNVDRPDATIGTGQTIPISMPGPGVVTIYQR